MQTILCNGCLGNVDPRASRTSASLAFGKSSILAAAARSGTVSRSHTMTDCSDMGLFLTSREITKITEGGHQWIKTQLKDLQLRKGKENCDNKRGELIRRSGVIQRMTRSLPGSDGRCPPLPCPDMRSMFGLCPATTRRILGAVIACNTTNLNALSCILQPQNAKNSFVEGTPCLHHIVMHVVNRRIDWDASHEVWMSDIRPLVIVASAKALPLVKTCTAAAGSTSRQRSNNPINLRHSRRGSPPVKVNDEVRELKFVVTGRGLMVGSHHFCYCKTHSGDHGVVHRAGRWWRASEHK
jgi:hypothetical protein